MPTPDDAIDDPTRTGRPPEAGLHSGSNKPTPTIQPAEKVGRFHVLGCIGMGGMGQVYAAYDPQLDRQIALKVLHEDRDREEDPRLIREAQALARLSHPNVVAVHDVGTHAGRLFVAMEFVEGITLQDWMREHPPGTAERRDAVLEALLQAGEGLAAAHRAGLVHRDFKPGNVLLGHDGRARVVDFGLVRVERPGASRAKEQLESLGQSDPDALDELEALLEDRPLTRSGAMLGTPAYMAPEQLLATIVNASSDQFAFCLTAWEALFGVRPFPGKSVPAILEAIRVGKPERPPEISCPAAIEKVLRKGFGFGPSRRHETMDTLLEALRSGLAPSEEAVRPPRPNRRRHWVGALLLTGTTATTAFALGKGDPQTCTGAEQHLAGIWDESVSARLESAFLETEASFAADTWTRFERGLDAYAREWIAGHRNACEATQIRKEQSSELMDLRMACLDERRQGLAALVEVYAEPDRRALARTDEALGALAPVVDCADLDYVRGRAEHEQHPEELTLTEDVRQALARSVAYEAAGRYDEAFSLADQAVSRTDEADSAKLRALAFLRRGSVHAHLHQGEKARTDLQQAYLLANRSGESSIVFEASRKLIPVNAVLLSRLDEGRWWAEVARFESQRSGDTESRARFLVDLGSMHRAAGRFLDAGEAYAQAVELMRDGDEFTDLDRAMALRALGELRLLQGGPERARTLLESAASTAEEVVGEDHPLMARFHTSLSRLERLAGRLDQALAHIDLAMTLGERAFGAEHVALHPVLEERCNVLRDRGDVEGALAQLERARTLSEPEDVDDAIRARLFATAGEVRFQQQAFERAEEDFRQAVELAETALGNVHPDTARYRIGLGSALGGQGRRREATALLEAGLAVREAVLGGQHPNVASTYDTLAAEMERVGDYEKVLEYTTRSLEIMKAAYGDDSLPLLRVHGNMCGVLGHLGRLDDALEHCERALAIARSTVSADPRLVAELHNLAGAALANSGQYTEASRHYERAKSVWEGLDDAEEMPMALILANLGEVALAKGEYGEAYERYADSLAIREHKLGASHPMVLVPLVGMANARAMQGLPNAAVPLAQRALAVSDERRAGALAHARAQEALARALWSEASQRPEAELLLEQVRETYEGAGPEAELDRARLSSWHPRR